MLPVRFAPALLAIALAVVPVAGIARRAAANGPTA